MDSFPVDRSNEMSGLFIIAAGIFLLFFLKFMLASGSRQNTSAAELAIIQSSYQPFDVPPPVDEPTP